MPSPIARRSRRESADPTADRRSALALPFKPAREAVAARAYSLWDQEGRPAGRDVEYWSLAEQVDRLLNGPRPDEAAGRARRAPRPFPCTRRSVSS